MKYVSRTQIELSTIKDRWSESVLKKFGTLQAPSFTDVDDVQSRQKKKREMCHIFLLLTTPAITDADQEGLFTTIMSMQDKDQHRPIDVPASLHIKAILRRDFSKNSSTYDADTKQTAEHANNGSQGVMTRFCTISWNARTDIDLCDICGCTLVTCVLSTSSCLCVCVMNAALEDSWCFMDCWLPWKFLFVSLMEFAVPEMILCFSWNSLQVIGGCHGIIPASTGFGLCNNSWAVLSMI